MAWCFVRCELSRIELVHEPNYSMSVVHITHTCRPIIRTGAFSFGICDVADKWDLDGYAWSITRVGDRVASWCLVCTSHHWSLHHWTQFAVDVGRSQHIICCCFPRFVLGELNGSPISWFWLESWWEKGFFSAAVQWNSLLYKISFWRYGKYLVLRAGAIFYLPTIYSNTSVIWDIKSCTNLELN